MGLIWDEVLAREQAYVIPTKGVNLANQHAPADELSRVSSAHSTASWLSTREVCQRRGFGPIPSAGCLVVGPCAAGSGTPCRAAEGLEVSPGRGSRKATKQRNKLDGENSRPKLAEPCLGNPTKAPSPCGRKSRACCSQAVSTVARALENESCGEDKEREESVRERETHTRRERREIAEMAYLRNFQPCMPRTTKVRTRAMTLPCGTSPLRCALRCEMHGKDQARLRNKQSREFKVRWDVLIRNHRFSW